MSKGKKKRERERQTKKQILYRELLVTKEKLVVERGWRKWGMRIKEYTYHDEKHNEIKLND